MNDDRLDQLIRASLEWQAEHAARRAPSLNRSVQHVAERLGHSDAGPVLMAGRSSGGGRSLQLVLVMILLLALLGAVLAIGSHLFVVRPIQPGPFGFARHCVSTLPDGVVMEVDRSHTATTVHADGTFVAGQPGTPGTHSDMVAGFRAQERRLAPRGIELIQERIAAAGLTPGCRSLRTQGLEGSVTALTQAGLIQVNWGPGVGQYGFGRDATPAEGAAIDALARALEDPTPWLPGNAWLEPDGQKVVPDRWIVIVSLLGTTMPPGEGGHDPRYAAIAMPKGAAPAEFGQRFPSPYSTAPGSSARCGIADREEALALATSLDAVQLEREPLITPDGSAEVSIEFEPAPVPSQGCAQAMERRSGAVPDTTRRLTSPEGDLSDVDPCSLVSAAAAEALKATATERTFTRLPLGAAARACGLGDASVTLYPRSVSRDEAQAIVLGSFGAGVGQETMDGSPVWFNSCHAMGTRCWRAIAVWADPYLILIDNGLPTMGPGGITLDAARATIAMILEDIRD